MGSVAHVFSGFRQHYPLATFDLLSGGTEQVLERLNAGVLDIAVLVEPPNLERYNILRVPGQDVWGAVVPVGHELAGKTSVTLEDLLPHPIIVSRQSVKGDLPRWAKGRSAELKIAGYYNLAYNGAVFTRAGLGITLCFDRLVECSERTDLVFVPLAPALTNSMYVVWKKQHRLPALVERFVEQLEKDLVAAGSS